MLNAERRISLRRLVLGVIVPALIVAGLAVVPVAAQDADIDGDYQVVNTVTETTQTCDAPDVGDSSSGVIRVRRLGAGKVEFSFGSNPLVATIDGDLNFDASSTASGADDTFEGHFTINSDGSASLEWTERVDGYCGDIGPGAVVYKLVGDRRATAPASPSTSTSSPAPTTSPSGGGKDATPSPSPSGATDLIGYPEALAEADAVCGGRHPQLSSVDCDRALHQADLWYADRRDTLAAARRAAGPELALPLARLAATASAVVRLQSLPIRACGSTMDQGYPARYPAIREAARFFDILWGQGLRATLDGDLAELETALTRADALLALLIEMERRDPVVCP